MDNAPNNPTALPPGYMETARVEIVKGLSPTGSEDVAFRLIGMNRAEAIGQLIGVADRLRQGQSEGWRNSRNDDEGEGGGY